MSTVRRRVLRPPLPASETTVRRQRQITMQRGQLAQHRTSLKRWMARLQRCREASTGRGPVGAEFGRAGATLNQPALLIDL
jgi:hypothetical protein